jgi:hypothetical protein
MVDRAWLARLLRRVRADSALPRTSRELGDVAANNLPRHVIGIASRGMEPTEEVRDTDRVSALRVDRAIAQAQFGKKLIARSNARTLRVANTE